MDTANAHQSGQLLCAAALCMHEAAVLPDWSQQGSVHVDGSFVSSAYLFPCAHRQRHCVPHHAPACTQLSQAVQEDQGDLEVTFGPGLEALSAKLAEKAAKGGKKRDTLWEDYMRRRRCLSWRARVFKSIRVGCGVMHLGRHRFASPS